MANADRERLSDELRFYAAHKDEWLRLNKGRYVVVKSQQLLGFFLTFSEAYLAGAEHWGDDTDFLVKCVIEQEPVFFVF